MKLRLANQKAFTLVELMVVAAIILILSTFVVVNVSGSQKKAKDDKRIVNVEMIGNALDQYAMEHGRVYPHEASPGTTINTDTYYFSRLSLLRSSLTNYVQDASIFDETKIEYVYKGDGTKAGVVSDKLLLDSSISKCNISIDPTATNPTIITNYLKNIDIRSADGAPVFTSPCYFIAK
jgi:prepilin-type N-terminal cleavage/methylation domain-containing protein